MNHNTWWLPKEKQFLSETKRWYCGNCDKRTPLERNPEWNGQFEGLRPAPDWFVRCVTCKEKHWQLSGYECPNCGCDNEENEVLEYANTTHNYGAAMQFGGDPMDWDEKHRCRKCRVIYWISNGNY